MLLSPLLLLLSSVDRLLLLPSQPTVRVIVRWNFWSVLVMVAMMMRSPMVMPIWSPLMIRWNLVPVPRVKVPLQWMRVLPSRWPMIRWWFQWPRMVPKVHSLCMRIVWWWCGVWRVWMIWPLTIPCTIIRPILVRIWVLNRVIRRSLLGKGSLWSVVRPRIVRCTCWPLMQMLWLMHHPPMIVVSWHMPLMIWWWLVMTRIIFRLRMVRWSLVPFQVQVLPLRVWPVNRTMLVRLCWQRMRARWHLQQRVLWSLLPLIQRQMSWPWWILCTIIQKIQVPSLLQVTPRTVLISFMPSMPMGSWPGQKIVVSYLGVMARLVMWRPMTLWLSGTKMPILSWRKTQWCLAVPTLVLVLPLMVLPVTWTRMMSWWCRMREDPPPLHQMEVLCILPLIQMQMDSL